MKYAIYSRKKDEITLNLISEIKENIKLEYDGANPDIVITVGGDGTFLRAVHHYIDNVCNIVFFGIKTGHLGFYSNYTKENINELFDKINNHTYEIEYHDLVKWECNGKSGYSLNEITIVNPTATQIVDVYIDKEKFETVRGTGLCISTTNGSTAYNKSLGGPVVDPKLDCIILSEMASINSNAYRSLNSSLVLSNNHKLELKSKNAMYLTSDHLKFEVDEENTVICYLADKKVKSGTNKQSLFIDRIKKSFL